MIVSLPQRIAGYLNNGDPVVAEVPVSIAGVRSFVRIRPIAKPGIPSEQPRYLNSPHDMWQYWDYAFRVMTLREGWEVDEWNYDRYLVGDETLIASSQAEFSKLLSKWVPDPFALRHVTESDCPE